ncbi:MAG: FAD-dependent oxidoreductase [Ignavibacteriales bacterium]|nr:FAD-dependent oxidoreductase [Ignavibacteriales bacterium]
MNKNIIVIGGNAAGPAAAAKAKRTDPYANVLLFEASEFISTGTCELPYVLSGEIKDYNDIVFYSAKSFEEEKGVKVYTNSLVTNIDRRNKTITVTNTSTNQSYNFTYDKLILTTGSISKRISQLPINLENVFSFKSVGDLIKVKSFIDKYNPKRVLVIGAGYIGIEISEALKNIGLEVILLEKEKLPMPGSEAEIQNLILQTLLKNKIQFFGNSIDVKYYFVESKLRSVKIDGWNYEIDFAIQSLGVKPNTTLALSAKLDLGNFGGIKVDSKLRTSDSNIYAAGDCIEVINKITNRNDYLPLATLAHEHGHIAGENAAGGNSFIHPVINNIAVKIFDNNFVSVGLNSIQAIKNNFNVLSVSAIVPNIIKVMPNSKNVFGKIIYEKDSLRILGANFFGDKEVIGFGDLISSFIYHKNKITDLAEINFNYTPPSSPFINLLSVLGRKAKKETR